MQSKRLDSNFFNYLFIYSLAEKSPITDQSYDILEIPFPVARVTLSCNYKKKNSEISLTVIVYNGWNESFEKFDRCRKKVHGVTYFVYIRSVGAKRTSCEAIS